MKPTDTNPDAVKIRECVACPKCGLTVNGLCSCDDVVQCNVCGFCATAIIGAKCLSEKQPACFGRMFIEPAVIDADWRCAPDFDQQDAFIERCIADAIRSTRAKIERGMSRD